MSAIVRAILVWKSAPNYAELYCRFAQITTQPSQQSVFSKIPNITDITILHVRSRLKLKCLEQFSSRSILMDEFTSFQALQLGFPSLRLSSASQGRPA